MSGLFYLRILLRPPGCDVVWLLGVLSCLVCFGLGVLFVCLLLLFIYRQEFRVSEQSLSCCIYKTAAEQQGKVVLRHYN